MAYGNEYELHFSVADLLHSNETKDYQLTVQQIHENSKGEMKEKHCEGQNNCYEITARMPPTRKLLTIREASCKKRPERVRLILCPKCPKMFTYQISYETHLQKKSYLKILLFDICRFANLDKDRMMMEAQWLCVGTLAREIRSNP